MELTYTDLSGEDVALLDFARADFAWGLMKTTSR